MKPLVFVAAILLFSTACKKNDNTNTTNQLNTRESQLQNDVASLQSQIRTSSTNIEGKIQLENKLYSNAEVQSEIHKFNSLRTQQKTVVNEIYALGSKPNIELLNCADFEDISCVAEEWDITKNSFQTVKIDSSDSYNETGSLYISSPFDTTKFNQRVVTMVGYINGIEEQTVYKIRWWAKIKGNTTSDNVPNIFVTAFQDGKYLGEGGNIPGNGSYLNDGWKLYSFQIISQSSSPLKVELYSNMQDCWIDDIHIVKKSQK